MLNITLATGNKHKVDEINLIAKKYNINFVLPQGDFDPVEDGSTFLENAYAKAKCASKSGKTELYLADDSGLCVDALDGAPGIHSARFASDAQKRINKLLDKMKDKKERSARFVCAMVVVDKNGSILFQTQAQCEGSIMYEQKGSGGFGYDPVFFVKSQNKTMAELTKEQKASVSHRARALNKVLDWLCDEYKRDIQ